MHRPNRRGVRNSFLAGSCLRTPSVNGALASGFKAAEEVEDFVAGRPQETACTA